VKSLRIDVVKAKKMGNPLPPYVGEHLETDDTLPAKFVVLVCLKRKKKLNLYELVVVYHIPIASFQLKSMPESLSQQKKPG